MSYDIEAAKLTRFAFTIVKIELDNSVSPSGDEYHCSGRSPLGQRFYSSIIQGGFDPTPTKMEPGKGLGFLGSVRVSMNDFPFGESGTYFGKLIANNPYYLDRPLKVYTGFYDGFTFDWANFKEKLYFIKKIDGPDSKGRVTITADDILTLLDEDQAQIPTAPNAKLNSALNSSDTGTLNIVDNENFSATGGTLLINDEYISYSGLSGSDSVITTARAQYGTTAAAHDADDPVIPCFSYSAENVVDVIYDLIDLYSPIDAATYINSTAWNTERDNYLIGDTVTGVLNAGEPIKDKINSLCEQTMVSCWWDDEDQLIKIKAIGPTITPSLQLNTTEHILDKGESINRDPSKAVTTLAVYFGRRDHTGQENAAKNYAELYVTPDAESTAGFGKDKIETIYAPDIPLAGTSTVNKMISRLFSQRRTGKTEYKFRLDAKDATASVGDLVQVTTGLIQDANGEATTESYLIIERDQISAATFQYTSVATGFLTTGPYRVIAPNTLSATTYATATSGERETYGFIADNTTTQFSNSDTAHAIL